MRNVLLLPLLLLPAGAQASVLTMTCRNASQEYQLVLDDETGSFTMTDRGQTTRLVLRGLRKDLGATTATGFVAGRGTDFTFNYRFSPTISFAYGNGGQRTDECRVVSSR